MGTEIERKFLVRSHAWREASTREPIAIRQGYLVAGEGASVRVRIADESATLTIKGERDGRTRDEFEYPIPVADAHGLHALCPHPLIEKQRHEITHCGKLWEVDEFGGALAGLVIAEVELDREDEAVELPDWVGEEVTHDVRYRNSSLVKASGPPSRPDVSTAAGDVDPHTT